MTAPVYCEQCEQMTHPTFPHSCFSAATLRAHKDAERAVIAAAKEMSDVIYQPKADSYREYREASDRLNEAVRTLRAVEGNA
jgi:hypothetical protein